MPLKCEEGILPRHPLTVILHRDPANPSLNQGNVNPVASGINRILDQFFDDGGGPLDDFSRGNFVGKISWKNVDLRQGGFPFVWVNQTVGRSDPVDRRTVSNFEVREKPGSNEEEKSQPKS